MNYCVTVVHSVNVCDTPVEHVFVYVESGNEADHFIAQLWLLHVIAYFIKVY